jgi:hypothetical protein
VLDVFDARGRDRYCDQFNKRVVDYILADKSIRTVVLVGRLVTLAHGKSRELGPAENDEPPTIAVVPGQAMDVPAAEALTRSAIHKTVRRLTDAGKRVVLVYPIPEAGYPVPLVLARLVASGREPGSFMIPIAGFEDRSQFINRVLDEVNEGAVVRIYPKKRLCSEHSCKVFAGRDPLYVDGDHLSDAGAEYIAPLFSTIFKVDY